MKIVIYVNSQDDIQPAAQLAQQLGDDTSIIFRFPELVPQDDAAFCQHVRKSTVARWKGGHLQIVYQPSKAPVA